MWSFVIVSVVCMVWAWLGHCKHSADRNAPPAKKEDTRTTVVLLSGYAGAGKDTAADLLVEFAGFHKLAFADVLRAVGLQVAQLLLGFPEARLEWFTDRRFKETPLRLLQRNASYINEVLEREARGDAHCPVGPACAMPRDAAGTSDMTPRKLLQVFGTDIVRRTLGVDVWVHAVMEKIKTMRESREKRGDAALRVVMSDCRFPNEVQAFLAARDMFKCITVRVEDPWQDSVAARHISETALDEHPFDVRIRNDKERGVRHLRYALWKALQVFDIDVGEVCG